MQKVLHGNVITNLRGTWDADIEDYTYLDAVHYKGSLYFGKERIISKGAEPGINDSWMLAVQGQGEEHNSPQAQDESIFVINATEDLNADTFYEAPYKGFITGERIVNFPATKAPLCFEVSITEDNKNAFQTVWNAETPSVKYFRTGTVTPSTKYYSASVAWDTWDSVFTQADFEAFSKDISQKHQLTEDTSFYVNATTGNDENKGDSPTNAFKTIQHAVNSIAANFDCNEHTCTLQVAAGSYEENVILPSYQSTSGVMILKGESKDTTLILTDSFSTDLDAGTWKIRNIHIRFKDIKKLTTGTVHLVKTQGRSEAFWDQCRFSCNEAPETATRDQIMFSAMNGGRNVLESGLEFMPGAKANVLHVLYAESGIIEHQGGGSYTTIYGALKPINGVNTKGICMKLSYLSTFKYTHPTGTEKPYFAGTLTNAYRYNIESTSICNVSGQGAAAFPGDTNGYLATAGQYY